MTTQSVRLRQHPELPNPVSGSGGEGFAALTATRRNDCTTRTGPHTKTEAVNARAASVVRLERPLALGHGQHSSKFIDASRRHGSNIGENSGVHPQVGMKRFRNWTRASTKPPPHHRVTVREYLPLPVRSNSLTCDSPANRWTDTPRID